MNLLKELKGFRGEIKFREPLSLHTTFKIGGKVKIWTRPQNYHSLRLLIRLAKISGIPIFMVGGGSNLLVRDYSLEAIAINLASANFSKINLGLNSVIAGAGIGISRLIERCCEADRGGLEFLAGIPATLGGAICTNAGAVTGRKAESMSDVVAEVKIMRDDGKIYILKRKDLEFGYRHSNLCQCIILAAKLKLKRRSGRSIGQLLRENLKNRQNRQELNFPSAGCIFKNPSKEAAKGLRAGYLIERAGFKGRRAGRAEVSARHANFIINRGGAKASDVIKLISAIKRRLKEKFAIHLEPEIKIIGRSRTRCFRKGMVNFLR